MDKGLNWRINLPGFASPRTLIMDHVKLDATGLKCPLPVLKAGKMMRQVPVGGTLEILATDPGSVQDFEAFCRSKDHALLERSLEDGVYRFVIRAGG